MATVAYRGNFRPAASTESHVAASLESLGHSVVRIQEDEVDWADTVKSCKNADVFLWTSTFGMAETWAREDAWKAVHQLNDMLPTVAYHLDLFWDLDREDQIHTVPWFRLNHVFTTDNYHDRWLEQGVNHHWLPPGVFHEEAYDGSPQRQYVSDIAFVGSWKQYAHTEHWTVRKAMLAHLKHRYRNRVKFWPRGQAVRGTDLTNLYASVKVVVGDSCLAGHVPGYVSDRVPEVMGRGGFLIHPHVGGLEEVFPYMVTYSAGDFDKLCELIDYYLTNEHERISTRAAQADHTRNHHTYRERMQTVLDIVLP